MWNRVKLTIIISALATVIFMKGSHLDSHFASPPVRMENAWWGTLYPEFCYSEIPEDAPDDAKIRIEFRWLHGL